MHGRRHTEAHTLELTHTGTLTGTHTHTGKHTHTHTQVYTHTGAHTETLRHKQSQTHTRRQMHTPCSCIFNTQSNLGAEWRISAQGQCDCKQLTKRSSDYFGLRRKSFTMVFIPLLSSPSTLPLRCTPSKQGLCVSSCEIGCACVCICEFVFLILKVCVRLCLCLNVCRAVLCVL